MIRVTGLTVRRGSFVLEGIDLEVPAGHSFVLLGPSGAGKTQLIETIMGLNRPVSGQVIVAGQDVTALAPERRRIGYLPQDLGLFPHLSVIDNILFGPRVQQLDQAQARDRLDRLVGLLGLEPFLGRRSIAQLSGGEKQRVALARALVVEPRVLFLDEPFASLDQMLRRELQLQFRALQQTLGVTFFFVTHDLDDAALLGDQIGVLMGGKLVQTGTVGEVFGQPATAEAARFLMWRNLVQGRVQRVDESGDVVTVEIGVRQLLECGIAGTGSDGVSAGQDVVVGLNAGLLRLRAADGGQRQAPVRAPDGDGRVAALPGRVSRCLDMAGHSVVVVDIVRGAAGSVSVEVDVHRDEFGNGSPLGVGCEVEIMVPRSAVAVFV
ncbi:MAG: ATP-binding cassette domain-containing protein [Planctomycetes bacterium]|nr:ATP-binding cassette domain-containing protein [Planctomycetota bacterium]NOG53464.1 ATP-binding cassette domain-containing protein [Planctomycetota bacterium]